MKIRPVTEQERESWPKTTMVELEKPFVDDRGEIQPLVDVSMKSCVLIKSKKGTFRADHYHQTDWHYCYVVEGEIDYFERPTGSDQTPIKTTNKKGEMVWTGPMQDHTMAFIEDTVFLTFGRNSRTQEIYESDVVRIPTLAPSE